MYQSLIFVREKVLTTVNRFPLASLCCLLFTFLSIYILEKGQSYATKYLHLSALGYFFFTALQLFVETQKFRKVNALLIGSFVFLFICLYFLFPFYPNATVSNFNLKKISIILSLFIGVFITGFDKNNNSNEEVSLFIVTIFKNIILTFLYSAFLALIIVFLVEVLRYLFSIEIKHNYFFYIVAVLTGLFAAPFMLSKIPNSITKEETEIKDIAIISNTYVIIIPFLMVYSFIIHAYSIKILILGTLPKGRIINLVGFYCLSTLLFYMLNYRFFTQKQIALINFFDKHFVNISLVPLILYLISITVRIEEYGFTLNRLVIILFFFWGSSSLYLIKIKDKNSLYKILQNLFFLFASISFFANF